MKIDNDKYYTSSDLAEYVVNKTKEIIGSENITEYIEPSAGAGVFLKYLDKPYKAYDIEPEGEGIIKQDWLTLDLEYKKGRCIIGNPPFGSRNILSMQFFKKSIDLCDYIAFILPISQLNNNQQMYEFDLIYSEDLGKRNYSGREVHCCLNIYCRPENGELNKTANKYKLNDITVKECRKSRNQYLPPDFKYDIGICSWGYVGKEVEYEGQYNQELYISINKIELKEKVLTIIKNANWSELYPMTTTPRLKQWQVLRYIKEQIPEIN